VVEVSIQMRQGGKKQRNWRRMILEAFLAGRLPQILARKADGQLCVWLHFPAVPQALKTMWQVPFRLADEIECDIATETPHPKDGLGRRSATHAFQACFHGFSRRCGQQHSFLPMFWTGKKFSHLHLHSLIIQIGLAANPIKNHQFFSASGQLAAQMMSVSTNRLLNEPLMQTRPITSTVVRLGEPISVDISLFNSAAKMLTFSQVPTRNLSGWRFLSTSRQQQTRRPAS